MGEAGRIPGAYIVRLLKITFFVSVFTKEHVLIPFILGLPKALKLSFLSVAVITVAGTGTVL